MSKFGACVDSTLTWIGNNKLSSFLIVCVFAFIVSTWTLAAINANLNQELQDERNRHTTPAAPDDTTSVDTTATTTTSELTTTSVPENSNVRKRRFA